MVFSAAETVCSIVIEVVTEPSPPGTGVMASTIGSIRFIVNVATQVAVLVEVDADVQNRLALAETGCVKGCVRGLLHK